MRTRGFTLIELLVVIAIIGILATIVLVSLGNARQNSFEVKILGNLNTIRTQAGLYADSNGNIYTSTLHQATAVPNASCGTMGMWLNPTIAQAIKSANAGAGTAELNSGADQSTVCKSGPDHWYLAVVKKSDPAKVWCVDSSGKIKEADSSSFRVSTDVGTLTACP